MRLTRRQWLALLIFGALLPLLGWTALGRVAGPRADDAAAGPSPHASPSAEPSRVQRPMPELPGGGYQVFGRRRFLVAYYGTGGTPVLGVLGESSPEVMHQRLMHAARPFVKKGENLQPVYELIVTVANRTPPAYSHDRPRAMVRDYLRAARKHKALVVLDLQPGRQDFLTVAKRWEWALKNPWVGLALDPEWRMGPRQVPGRVFGSVRAREVNAVSKWLNDLTVRHNLPEKVFMLHTFRTDMLPDVGQIKQRSHLAEVMHVDGFGPPGAKLSTYNLVAKPKQFTMGFKVFYDEDVPRMSPASVRAVGPEVRFVSFQ